MFTIVFTWESKNDPTSHWLLRLERNGVLEIETELDPDSRNGFLSGLDTCLYVGGLQRVDTVRDISGVPYLIKGPASIFVVSDGKILPAPKGVDLKAVQVQ